MSIRRKRGVQARTAPHLPPHVRTRRPVLRLAEDGSHVAVSGYGTGTASVANVATGVTVAQVKVSDLVAGQWTSDPMAE
jgi:hypothetical protein